MENGEVDATIFSDYFVIANYPDDMRMICSITYSPEFQDEACCVTAMNNDFLEKNPVHAKYIVKAIKRAGEYARLNSEDAVQLMYDTDKMTGERQYSRSSGIPCTLAFPMHSQSNPCVKLRRTICVLALLQRRI